MRWTIKRPLWVVETPDGDLACLHGNLPTLFVDRKHAAFVGRGAGRPVRIRLSYQTVKKKAARK